MRNIDSTKGPIAKNMMKLAWPIAVTNIINVFYNIADTFFVGQLENSAAAISAVTLTFSVVFLLVADFDQQYQRLVLSLHLGVLVHHDLIHKYLHHLFYLC